MNFSMIIVNSNRSKSYLQNLLLYGFKPNKVIVLEDGLTEGSHESSPNIKKVDGLELSFDENEHVISTLEKHKLNYVILHTLDVNSVIVAEEIRAMKDEYIIYSGRGGAIVSKDVLSLGKRFIHVHSGWVPEYRGSTTMYYSLLIDGDISCSIIILDPKIDTGDILYRKKYTISNNEHDYDYTLDPLLRADTLIHFLKERDQIEPLRQTGTSNTFFIIHPVLKNISILKHSNKLKKG